MLARSLGYCSTDKKEVHIMTMQQETRSGQGEVLDNICYDLVTVIAEKSKGLEAYDTYMKDTSGQSDVQQVFQKIRKQDQQAVKDLMDCLHTHLHNKH
jgi:hypothetical protein